MQSRALHLHRALRAQLNERRKRKLARLVPFEMRAVLNETLNGEPNLRPSAHYALQVSPSMLAIANANSARLTKMTLKLSWPSERSALAWLETSRDLAAEP